MDAPHQRFFRGTHSVARVLVRLVLLESTGRRESTRRSFTIRSLASGQGARDLWLEAWPDLCEALSHGGIARFQGLAVSLSLWPAPLPSARVCKDTFGSGYLMPWGGLEGADACDGG